MAKREKPQWLKDAKEKTMRLNNADRIQDAINTGYDSVPSLNITLSPRDVNNIVKVCEKLAREVSEAVRKKFPDNPDALEQFADQEDRNTAQLEKHLAEKLKAAKSNFDPLNLPNEAADRIAQVLAPTIAQNLLSGELGNEIKDTLAKQGLVSTIRA